MNLSLLDEIEKVETGILATILETEGHTYKKKSDKALFAADGPFPVYGNLGSLCVDQEIVLRGREAIADAGGWEHDTVTERHQGKGVLKEISRGRIPDAVIDRPKGYFPMPALKYVRGEFLEFMKEILLSDGAKQRGLYNGAYVEKLLADPESYHTRLQGSKLWHLAALELWWQQNIAECR